jgi:hypothetical protein
MRILFVREKNRRALLRALSRNAVLDKIQSGDYKENSGGAT